MSDQLTLVSYIAPVPRWNASTAYEQQIFDEASGTFAPGTYSLTVLIPNSYYQIDFVCGPAINVLVPLTYNGSAYGPDNSNIWYHGEDRFIDSDNGGTAAFTTKSVASGDFATAAYWSTTTGQNVIKSLNGGSSATSLAQWLATTFPNLYGSGAGSHSPGQLQRLLLHQQPGGVRLCQLHGRRPASAVGGPVRLCHEHQPRGHQRA